MSTEALQCHGICHLCSKRTFLWLPGRICGKCLQKIQDQMIKALAEYEEEDADVDA